ncbi:MAG: LemA family protein [Pygmaiobacter sp.]
MHPILVILTVVVVGSLWFVGTYNGLVRSRTEAEEAFSTMDVYLKKRFDLIPNLVETVKGYAKHESETLEKVIAARNAVAAAPSDAARAEGENMISGALRQIFALSESYPDLKANTNFQDLQAQLKSAEQDIANARKFYNATVREYNIKVQSVPSNLVAMTTGFKKKPLYEVTDSAERENVQVKF